MIFFLDISSGKLTENYPKNRLNTSKKFPEAPPPKPEIASEPVRHMLSTKTVVFSKFTMIVLSICPQNGRHAAQFKIFLIR